MKFNIEFTTKAIKDLNVLPLETQKIILEESINLETSPFPFKSKIKKIKGIKFRCYRLRIDCMQNSFRLFYGIDKETVLVLRIIAKKDAEKIIKNLKKTDFLSLLKSN